MNNRFLRGVLIILALSFPPSAATADTADEVNIVRYNFPVWEDVTDLDGSGLYSRLIETVYTAAGYTAIRAPGGDVPWKKCIRNVILGKSDATGAEYRVAIKKRGMIHPKGPLIIQTIFSLYRKDAFPDGFAPDKIEGKSVVEILGYELASVLGLKGIRLSQAADEKSIARMLLRNRTDVALLEGYYLELARAAYPDLRSERFGAEALTTQPLFLMFANTPDGKKKAEAWDRGLRKLLSGKRIHELVDLYEKYDLSYLAPDYKEYVK